MRFPRILMAGLAAPALFVMACGGGGGGHANNAAGLESAARDAWNAIYSGDTDEAYRFLTEECKEQVSERDFREAMSFIPAFIAGFLGVDPDDIEVAEVETRDVGDGQGEARVVLDVGNDDVNEMLNEGNEFEAWVYQGGRWRIADCEEFADGDGDLDFGDEDEDDAFEDDPSEDSETSRDDPAPLGTAVEVSGWEITVNSVNRDAEDEVLAEDEFIDPPEEGKVFVLINVTARYVGDGENDSSTLFSAVTWGAVGDSAVAYDEFDDSCTFFALPDALDSSAEVFEGGTIEGNICFSVLEEDAASLLLYADEGFGFRGSGREFFSLR